MTNRGREGEGREDSTPRGVAPVDFLDPRTTPFVPMQSRGELPHLYKPDASYFVTFRLWDAVGPPEAKRQWERLNRQCERPGMSLDRGWAVAVGKAAEPPLRLGSCVLARPEAAKLVSEALCHFDGERYQLAAWCVMPNHVHAAYTVVAGHSPDDIHHSWKSYTAKGINRLLSGQGTVWERESFDHVIRSAAHYEAYVDYIEENPVEAALCGRREEWPWSSAGSVRR